MDGISGNYNAAPSSFQAFTVPNNNQECTSSQQRQGAHNTPSERELSPEDPLAQDSNNNAPIVVQPYAIEEPEDDDSPHLSSKPTTAFTPGPSSENWQAELANSMEDLRCDSDPNSTSPNTRYNRGKKRKPPSIVTANPRLFHKQDPGMAHDRQYEERPNSKLRKLRRRNKYPQEALGMSDVGLSEFETSGSCDSRSSSTESNDTNSSEGTNAPDHMDLD